MSEEEIDQIGEARDMQNLKLRTKVRRLSQDLDMGGRLIATDRNKFDSSCSARRELFGQSRHTRRQYNSCFLVCPKEGLFLDNVD
jgi:hypothetical protein